MFGMGLSYKAVACAGQKVLTDASEGEGVVETFVSVTGMTDEVHDIIEPGAYQKTLATRTPKGVWGHDWNKPVAKTLSIEELMPGDSRLPATDRFGNPWPSGAGALFVKTQFNLETQAGKDAYSNVKFYGAEAEWSIGYQVPVGGSTFDTKQGVRKISTIELYEYSPVLWGAMPSATTQNVKSLDGTAVPGMKVYAIMPGSYEAIADSLRQAVNATIQPSAPLNGGPSPSSSWTSIEATFPDRVVWSVNGNEVGDRQLWEATYTVNGSTVDLGVPTAVTAMVQLMPTATGDGGEDAPVTEPTNVDGIDAKALEGKAGRVLSGSNVQLLTQADDAIHQVLASMGGKPAGMDDAKPAGMDAAKAALPAVEVKAKGDPMAVSAAADTLNTADAHHAAAGTHIAAAHAAAEGSAALAAHMAAIKAHGQAMGKAPLAQAENADDPIPSKTPPPADPAPADDDSASAGADDPADDGSDNGDDANPEGEGQAGNGGRNEVGGAGGQEIDRSATGSGAPDSVAADRDPSESPMSATLSDADQEAMKKLSEDTLDAALGKLPETPETQAAWQSVDAGLKDVDAGIAEGSTANVDGGLYSLETALGDLSDAYKDGSDESNMAAALSQWVVDVRDALWAADGTDATDLPVVPTSADSDDSDADSDSSDDSDDDGEKALTIEELAEIKELSDIRRY